MRGQYCGHIMKIFPIFIETAKPIQCDFPANRSDVHYNNHSQPHQFKKNCRVQKYPNEDVG